MFTTLDFQNSPKRERSAPESYWIPLGINLKHGWNYQHVFGWHILCLGIEVFIMLFSCPLHLKCLLLNIVKFTCHFGIKGECGRLRAKIIGFLAKWSHSPYSMEVFVKVFIVIFTLIASIFVDTMQSLAWIAAERFLSPLMLWTYFALLIPVPAAAIMSPSFSPAFCPAARRHDSAV